MCGKSNQVCWQTLLTVNELKRKLHLKITRHHVSVAKYWHYFKFWTGLVRQNIIFYVATSLKKSIYTEGMMVAFKTPLIIVLSKIVEGFFGSFFGAFKNIKHVALQCCGNSGLWHKRMSTTKEIDNARNTKSFTAVLNTCWSVGLYTSVILRSCFATARCFKFCMIILFTSVVVY